MGIIRPSLPGREFLQHLTRLGAACDKELWRNCPEFQKPMVKLPQEYAATEGFTLS